MPLHSFMHLLASRFFSTLHAMPSIKHITFWPIDKWKVQVSNGLLGTIVQNYKIFVIFFAYAPLFFIFQSKMPCSTKKNYHHANFLQKKSYLCTILPRCTVFPETQAESNVGVLHFNHAFTRSVFGVIEPEKFNKSNQKHSRCRCYG